MAPGDGYLEKLDVVLIQIFTDWNVYTTTIATVLLLVIAYPWLTWREPDTHPFLLARQASTSPVRQSGQSATYRSIEIPYGYPLRAGLGVKDPDVPKWSPGRNGDVRDIWRQAASGAASADGTTPGASARLLTILGREKVIGHSFSDVTLEINVIGKYIQELQGKRAAICLSNSVELLASIFAAAFYGFQPVLVAHNLSTEKLAVHLSKVEPEFLIAEAGAVEIEPLLSACSSIRHVILVVKQGNRHMDWSEALSEKGKNVEVVVWHDLVAERRRLTDAEVLPLDKESKVLPLKTFWPIDNGIGELAEYTSENLIAAVAAAISALPRSCRIGTKDLLLSTVPLTFSYALVLTFAALYSNASVAFNSVAGQDVAFTHAASGVSPTILVTSSKTILDYHDKTMAAQTGVVSNVSRRLQQQVMAAGNMPSRNPVAQLAEIDKSLSLSKLQLLFVSHRAGDATSPRLTSKAISDLRMLLGARIGYALTTAHVAGAVCQTNVYDYRTGSGTNSFGPPLSSVEIRLMGDEEIVSQSQPQGKIVVKGPAVCGDEAVLSAVGRMGEDSTLSLV